MSDMGEILGTPPAGDDNPEGFVSNDQSEDRAGTAAGLRMIIVPSPAGTAAGASTDTGPAPDTESDAGEVDEESLDTGDTETGPQA